MSQQRHELLALIEQSSPLGCDEWLQGFVDSHDLPMTRSPVVTPLRGLDAVLFGGLWPLADNVRLDPTIDRPVLRRQAARLKELGYHFQPLGRVWKQDA